MLSLRGKFHEAEKYRYKDEKCYRCHKKGHKCRANPKTNPRNGQKRGNTHHMEATGSEEEEEENGEDYTMFTVVAEVVSKMGVLGQFLYILLIYALFGLNLGNPV